MTWEIVAAVSEFIGSIGVIITLVFLAIQIHQNTTSIKAQSELEMSFRISDWYSRVNNNPALGEIFDNAFKDPDSLNNGELAQFLWHISELYSIYEGCYYLYRKGDIEKNSWNSKMEAATHLLDNPLVAKWWELKSAPLSEEFRSHIQGLKSKPTNWRQTTSNDFNKQFNQGLG